MPSGEGGNHSIYTGAAALLATMPPAKALLADRGYDAERLRRPCRAPDRGLHPLKIKQENPDTA